MIVLISSCLFLCLTACTTERKIYANQSIPANLLNDCTPKRPPKSMTFGDSVRYNEHLLNVIEMCNQDKRAIRLIQDSKT
ncbi:Rz1-like lysis system protein LysC [Gilliamella apicola]|uniref:Rz1-like lysis system protein LysC n=1 Tax=Gilliamella apicola TaxID=1196095 RepID=UPI00117B416A